MELLHEELRRAREAAGLSQQALANLAGIPRNQVVRAERGDNITIDTLRKIAAHVGVTELTLLDTTGLRVDIIADPEKLFLGAMENVLRLNEALLSTIQLAMDARASLETARRMAPPMPAGLEEGSPSDALRTLRDYERVAAEVHSLVKQLLIAEENRLPREDPALRS